METKSSNSSNGEHLLTEKDAIVILKMSRTSLYRLVKAGKIVAVYEGRSKFYRRSDLDNYIAGLEPVQSDVAVDAVEPVPAVDTAQESKEPSDDLNKIRRIRHAKLISYLNNLKVPPIVRERMYDRYYSLDPIFGPDYDNNLDSESLTLTPEEDREADEYIESLNLLLRNDPKALALKLRNDNVDSTTTFYELDS